LSVIDRLPIATASMQDDLWEDAGMDIAQLLVIAIVVFAGNAISRTPAHSRRFGRPMLIYWLNAYCLIFFGVYLAFRLITPQHLAGELAPNDGFVWWLVTVGWAAALSGVLVGRWVRGLRRGRAPGNEV
jgi:predicted MFS family arabinose efflux permease